MARGSIMKTRWRVLGTDLAEREKDYTATFVMLNVDTGDQVTVALTAQMGGPATDLVGACRATATMLVMAAGATDSDSTIESLN
jgi:hypothetical protein